MICKTNSIGRQDKDFFFKRFQKPIRELNKEQLELLEYSGYLKDLINPEQKIIILGDIRISEGQIFKIAASYGIKHKQFFFYKDYCKIKNIDFSFIRKNPKFAGVLIGPKPHKTSFSNESDNSISRAQQIGNLPIENVATFNGELKITQTSFKYSLIRLLYKILLIKI